LALSQAHSSSKRETQDRAAQALAKLQPALSPDIFESASNRGRARDFNQVVAEIIAG
jgi:hypothetical protein